MTWNSREIVQQSKASVTLDFPNVDMRENCMREIVEYANEGKRVTHVSLFVLRSTNIWRKKKKKNDLARVVHLAKQTKISATSRASRPTEHLFTRDNSYKTILYHIISASILLRLHVQNFIRNGAKLKNVEFAVVVSVVVVVVSFPLVKLHRTFSSRGKIFFSSLCNTVLLAFSAFRAIESAARFNFANISVISLYSRDAKRSPLCISVGEIIKGVFEYIELYLGACLAYGD